MILTRKQAIAEHRKMWNWISDETYKQKRKVEKNEYFSEMGIHNTPLAKCYCCEFSERNYGYCGECCIINWGNGVGCQLSYYKLWIGTLDWEEAYKLAHIIANLPEREV